MKCLSVWQPWASAFFEDGKPVENRSWATDYRGPLLIHASKKQDDAAMAVCNDICPRTRSWAELVTGAILGKVELVACVPVGKVTEYLEGQNELRWAFGPWCWILKNRRKFRAPVKFRGAQGLFEVPDYILEYQEAWR